MPAFFCLHHMNKRLFFIPRGESSIEYLGTSEGKSVQRDFDTNTVSLDCRKLPLIPGKVHYVWLFLGLLYLRNVKNQFLAVYDM
jgi:hypothetical protein